MASACNWRIGSAGDSPGVVVSSGSPGGIATTCVIKPPTSRAAVRIWRLSMAGKPAGGAVGGPLDYNWTNQLSVEPQCLSIESKLKSWLATEETDALASGGRSTSHLAGRMVATAAMAEVLFSELSRAWIAWRP